MSETLTIMLPEPALHKAQQVAALTYRSLSEVVSRAIDAAFSAPPELSPALAQEWMALLMYSDDELRVAAEPLMTPLQQQQLQALNDIAERAAQTQLLEIYQHSVLHRARALSILAVRDHALPNRDDWLDDDDENS